MNFIIITATAAAFSISDCLEAQIVQFLSLHSRSLYFPSIISSTSLSLSPPCEMIATKLIQIRFFIPLRIIRSWRGTVRALERFLWCLLSCSHRFLAIASHWVGKPFSRKKKRWKATCHERFLGFLWILSHFLFFRI